MEENGKETDSMFLENGKETDSMLLSPTSAPRPRTVTCISAPDDSSQGKGSMARPRSKSVRNQVNRLHTQISNFHRDVRWICFCRCLAAETILLLQHECNLKKTQLSVSVNQTEKKRAS